MASGDTRGSRRPAADGAGPGERRGGRPRARPRGALYGSQVDRYLRLLRVGFRTADFPTLTQLTLAHAARVPFENVSKLYRMQRGGLVGVPTIDAHLEGIERFHFGGTCYAVNSHLFSLLRALGYEVELRGADMREPDAHLVIVARVEGREYLVDAGYAAPFLHPLPLDLPRQQEIVHGEDRYVLHPRDEAGRSRLALWRRGKRVHGYVLKPGPRHVGEFAGVVARSFAPGAVFMRTVLLTRYAPGDSVAIHGPRLLRCEGERVAARTIDGRDGLLEEVERWFGIPAHVTAKAVTRIDRLEDPWQ